MLLSHFNAQENSLLSKYRNSSISGHPVNKGDLREDFVRNFLASHLAESVAIGSGEIIDSSSLPGEKRNQIDIVVHRRDFPKLDFEGSVNTFLVESVVAAIEVKSTLNEVAIMQSVKSAKNVKQLKPSVIKTLRTGWSPDVVLNYVVAYNGPANMETVYSWIVKAHQELNVPSVDLPPTLQERQRIPSPSLDAVFVLGKGFLYFDNVPLSSLSDDHRKENPRMKWIISDGNVSGSLMLLFLFLSKAVAGIHGRMLDPAPYVEDFKYNAILGQD